MLKYIEKSNVIIMTEEEKQLEMFTQACRFIGGNIEQEISRPHVQSCITPRTIIKFNIKYNYAMLAELKGTGNITFEAKNGKLYIKK